MKAISYLRFSTRAQGKEGRDSYRRQSGMAEAWSKLRNIPLDKSLRFEDLGVSGFRGKNASIGALRAILDEVRKPCGRISPGDYLLVEAIDRLSRMKPLDAFNLCRELVEAGLVIVTLADNQEYSRESLNSGQGTIYVLLGAIQSAHEYSKRLSQRVTHSNETKRKAIATGARAKHSCPRWLKWDDRTKSYIAIAERADVVRRIFNLVLEGWSTRDIIRDLDRSNAPCWGRSGGWKMSVPSILRQPEVTGFRLVRKRGDDGTLVDVAQVDDYYPEVVDRATYDRVHQLLDEKAFWARGNARKQDEAVHVTNLFTGRLKCAACGDRLTIQTSGNKRGGFLRYAVCMSHRIAKRCSGKTSVNYDTLESKLLTYMAQELNASDLLTDPTSKSELARLTEEVQSTEIELQNAEAKAERIAINLVSEDLTDAAKKRVHALLNDAEAKVEALRSQLEKARADADRLQSSLSSADQSLREVSELINSTSDEARTRLRAAIASLVEEVTIDTTGSPGRCREPRICIRFRTGFERDIFVPRWEMPAIGMAARVPLERRREKVVNRGNGEGKKIKSLGELVAAGVIPDVVEDEDEF